MAAQKKQTGRPPHEPSDEARAQVRALVVAGINEPQIAAIIGVSEPTLRKYYADDLAQGLDRTIANVANTLVQKALNGDTASIIFFLKVRGKKYGWSERLEVAGPDGGPIQTEDVTKRDADEFARRISGLAARAGAGGGTGEADA